MSNFIQKFAISSGFFYNKQRKTFTAEASSVAWPGGIKKFELVNKKTKGSVVFNFEKADMDSTQEDTYGWWFSSSEGFKCLIIND